VCSGAVAVVCGAAAALCNGATRVLNWPLTASLVIAQQHD